MGSENLISGLPSRWETLTLSECTVDGNISYEIVQPGKHLPDGVPVVRVNNIRDGRLDLQDVLHVATEIEQKYSRTQLHGGEVLLTLVGSAGQSLVVPESLQGWNVARAIAVIKPKKNISAKWIHLCLQTGSAQHFLDARANTTVQKTLNLKDVKNVPIILPPEAE
ncbi:MAG: restriction endonuclease subunit S [Cyanobacteria bacterium P01_F01_bin.13]